MRKQRSRNAKKEDKMGLLDSIKNSLKSSVNSSVNNAISGAKSSVKSGIVHGVDNMQNKAKNAIASAINTKTKKFKFNTLPKNVEELKALDECKLTDYFATAAMAVLMLNVWADDPEAGQAILEYLNGPYEVTDMDRQFVHGQFADESSYIPRSYFKGATPDNNYTPEQPYTLEIIENSHSKDNYSDGYITLYCESGGADSPRNISLRQKKSTGEWFINDFRALLLSIRKPKEQNPWA